MKTHILALALLASPLAAQQQTDFRWEKALAAGTDVQIHNLNGDVTVSPSTSGKVEVTATYRGRDREEVSVAVVETARGIVVCAMFKAMNFHG